MKGPRSRATLKLCHVCDVKPGTDPSAPVASAAARLIVPGTFAPHLKGPLVASGRTAEIFAWDEGYVLKLIRPGFPPDLADHEAAILRRARSGGIACPAVNEVLEVEGRRGIVLERLPGPSMLDRVLAETRKAASWGEVLGGLHGAMHARTIDEPPSLRERLAHVIREGRSLGAETRRSILRLLDFLPDGQSVCHGDFHPGNVILAPERPVIIDWLDASIGHPLGDVARTFLLLELGRPPLPLIQRLRLESARRAFRRGYATRYAQIRPFAMEELRPWRAVVAGARLEERIPGERRALLKMVGSIT